MSQQKIDLTKLVSASLDLVKQAGVIIREVNSSGDLQIKDKGGDDPMTIADLRAQQLIAGGLIAQWPNIRIIGEEDTEPTKDAPKPNTSTLASTDFGSFEKLVPLEDVTVYIDPLDATKEFTLGNVECVLTLVGIAVKDKAVGGIMYQPFVGNGRMAWGLVGYGAHGDITYQPNTDPKRTVVCTTRSHGSKIIEEGLKKLSPTEIMRVGGAGYKSLLLLEGKADIYLYPQPGTKKWDTCAPDAVLQCVGGKLTDGEGVPINYSHTDDVRNLKGVIATSKLHDKYIGMLKAA
eukprot:CAMPEP_0168512678 /NCGR_PEP_ID=MMETSP0405-20121227/2955_1 /TAXON_ID=498012 /ORGANISM="Trichosphaerium sp, Strain Am-I-7 wt" /LENGTH=290 /DNA_ID=CAMNT_0008531255 /DNA_START=44 /DNA_END=912 /DNA_ORIENTATION=+